MLVVLWLFGNWYPPLILQRRSSNQNVLMNLDPTLVCCRCLEPSFSTGHAGPVSAAANVPGIRDQLIA